MMMVHTIQAGKRREDSVSVCVRLCACDCMYVCVRLFVSMCVCMYVRLCVCVCVSAYLFWCEILGDGELEGTPIRHREQVLFTQ